MKKTVKNRTSIGATLVASCLIFLFSTVLLLHLASAAMLVQYETSSAAELYHAQSLSPNGTSQTWDEILEEIKSEYADGSWAIRIASGNTDKATSFVLVVTVVIALIASLIAIRVELQISEKKAKAKRRAEARRKAEAEKKQK